MKPFDIVIVTWTDAMIDGAAQYNSVEEVILNYYPCVRRTVGFFVACTEEVYILATDDDRTENDRQAVGGIIYIPRALVTHEELIA